MKVLWSALLLALAGCRPPSSSHTLDDFAVAATQPSEYARFRLYVWMQQVGSEEDTYTPTADGGLEAKASFMLTDRSSAVPLAVSYRLDRDGWPRRLDAWGYLARDQPLDDHVRALGDGRFAVRRLEAPPHEVTVAKPYAAAVGYAPMLGQDLLLRSWLAHGRPPRMALLPDGEAKLESLGHEQYSVEGKPRDFEHVVVEGLAWGRQDAWLDDHGVLAAVVTRDSGGSHFEGVRREYVALIELLMARAGADAVRWLASAARPSDDGATAVALVGGRLIDGSGAAAVEDAVVVYQGDRILAVGPRATTAIPPGARRVDVRGKSILPGLWDMHGHLQQIEQAATYLASGITSVRDEGNVLGFITAIRDAIEDGRGIGPRLIVDALVDGTGVNSLGDLQIEREADIAPLVERLVRARCAEVKVYGVVKAELVAPLVAEAHRRGLRVTGHIPFGITAEQAVDLGFDGIDHVDMIESMIYPWDLAELRKLSPAERLRRMTALDVESPMVQRLLGEDRGAPRAVRSDAGDLRARRAAGGRARATRARPGSTTSDAAPHLYRRGARRRGAGRDDVPEIHGARRKGASARRTDRRGYGRIRHRRRPESRARALCGGGDDANGGAAVGDVGAGQGDGTRQRAGHGGGGQARQSAGRGRQSAGRHSRHA